MNWLQWSDADSPLLHKSKDNYTKVISWMGLGFQSLFFLYVSLASVEVPVVLKLQKSAVGIVC